MFVFNAENNPNIRLKLTIQATFFCTDKIGTCHQKITQTRLNGVFQLILYHNL